MIGRLVGDAKRRDLNVWDVLNVSVMVLGGHVRSLCVRVKWSMLRFVSQMNQRKMKRNFVGE